MNTKLQIALDDISLEEALCLLEKVRGYADIVEVGTPFLMKYGISALERIRESCPGPELLLDAKIMDAGAYEAELGFAAGAGYVTVLAVTDDATVHDVVQTSAKHGGMTVADMICVKDLKKRVRELENLGVQVIAVHTGVDQQALGRTPLEDLKEIRSCSQKAMVAVAGGITAASIDEYLKYRPDIVIVGGGILHAEDPAAAAMELKQKIRDFKA